MNDRTFRAVPGPASIALAGALLLGGCGEDPMGPENRLALLAWGRCQPDEALRLADAALATDKAEVGYRALVLKAAMLREAGDSAGAQALYPAMEAKWREAKERGLNERRRERDIRMLLSIAESERHANGLTPDCAEPPSAPGSG